MSRNFGGTFKKTQKSRKKYQSMRIVELYLIPLKEKTSVELILVKSVFKMISLAVSELI
jgi:hypothetical protein